MRRSDFPLPNMFAEDDINADWTGAQIGNNDSEFLNLANLIYLT